MKHKLFEISSSQDDKYKMTVLWDIASSSLVDNDRFLLPQSSEGPITTGLRGKSSQKTAILRYISQLNCLSLLQEPSLRC